jgi:hypothetical protein
MFLNNIQIKLKRFWVLAQYKILKEHGGLNGYRMGFNFNMRIWTKILQEREEEPFARFK